MRIHMNGRAYDYNLGRFLSVDPFVQAPGNSQSMNPYSYIMNNPLAGTDPTGYVACDESGKNCDIGSIEAKDVESIQITEDGNAVVNTTDGNSYQVETHNGKDVQGSFKGAHRMFKAIEQIGNLVRNMPAADGNFDPSRSEFRADSDDPRNQYDTLEYSENVITDSNGNTVQKSYGGTYTWQPVPADSNGNHYTRHKSTDWVLIRAPSESESASKEGDNLLMQVLVNMLPPKRLKAVLDLAVEAHDVLKDEYLWYRENRQEELMMEFRNDAIKRDRWGSGTSIQTEIYNMPNQKATGRIQWSVIPGTEKDEFGTFPKDYNPNNGLLKQ